MLCEVSTSSGATIPGKITMSERPSTGTISGTEREEIFPGTVSDPAEDAPKMLINSVSGEVIRQVFDRPSEQYVSGIIFQPGNSSNVWLALLCPLMAHLSSGTR